MGIGEPSTYNPNDYDRIVKNKINNKYYLQARNWDFLWWKFETERGSDEYIAYDTLERAKAVLKVKQDKRREIKYKKHYVVIKT